MLVDELDMHKSIVINDNEHETRVALVEDGTIAELFIERSGDSDIAGNIYKGRVQRVLPGMQAAFVDIGLSQAAFIYVADVILENYIDSEPIYAEDGEEEGEIDFNDLSGDNTPVNGKRDLNIEDLLVEGQEPRISLCPVVFWF
jgi:ribonuclease G